QEAFGNTLVIDYGQSSKTGRVTSIKTTLAGNQLPRPCGSGTTATGWTGTSCGAPTRWPAGTSGSSTTASPASRSGIDADSTGKPLSGSWTVNYTLDDFGNLTRRQFVAGISTGGT